MKILIFIDLFLNIFSVVPIWNLKNCSIDLLQNSNYYSYIIADRYMYEMRAKLEKIITKTDDAKIIHENTLYIDEISKGKVSFENIDSFYKFDHNKKLLCPMGKYHPIDLDNMMEIENNDFDRNNSYWDLKCYNHNAGGGYFLVFYLNNEENQVYSLEYDNNIYVKYPNLQIYEEMYDFKLLNKDFSYTAGPYPMCSLIKWNNFIQFLGTEYNLDGSQPARNMDKSKTLITSKEYSQGYFKNTSNDFYYITYNNANDFSSGFSNKTVEGMDFYSSNVEVINNDKSPFEFIDEVEIKEMKFLLFTKYVYYSIYNKKTKETYHGVLDVIFNKIIFNTNEDIDIFIPYSTNSMLAITNETAYRICFIKDTNGNCSDECSSGNIILDVNGNRCGVECESDQYIIIPEEVCSLECNKYIYASRGNKCGLCRDIDSENKYKLINGTECLKEVIDGSEVYNSELYLLVCKSGYILDQSICIPHCYEDCELCSEYSTDILNQKCTACKERYYLDEDFNCKKIMTTTLTPEVNIEPSSLNVIYTDSKGDFIPKCRNGLIFFSLNNSCLEKCPPDYEVNNENANRILKKSGHITNLDEFKNQVLQNLSSYINSSSFYNGSDFIAKILSSNNTDQIKIGFSEIYLGICPKILKDYYNISKEEDLIFLIIESKNNEMKKNESKDEDSFHLGINILLNIFDISGRKLDLSFCDNLLKITHDISELKEIDIQSAMKYAKQGIDVFNASDDFFNDLCHPYDDEDGKDIIIKDRRDDIYQNATFCQIGCNYLDVDYNLIQVSCLCNSNYLQGELDNKTVGDKGINELINFKTLKNTFKENMFISNLNVIYCYNLIFDTKFLKINIGFYCFSLMFISQIILFSFFLRKKLITIKFFMLSFKSLNKDDNKKIKKKKNVSFFVKKETKKKNKKSKRFTSGILPSIDNIGSKSENDVSNKKIQFIKENNELNDECEINLEEILTEQNDIKNHLKKKTKKRRKESKIDCKSNVSSIKSSKKLNNLDLDIKRKLKSKDISQRKSEFNKIETGNEININKSEEIKSIKITKAEDDLKEMKFEDIIIHDKRSCLRMYWAYFIDSKIILGTFCTENNLNKFEIKLSFFIYTFQISLFLNALFYSDEYISDTYYNNGILDFVSGLPKSIYSAIVSFIITTLLKMLSNSEKELNKIIKENNKDKNYEEVIDNKLKKLRNKLIAYYFLVFSLGLIFLYFVSTFCAVYRYSQKYWFFGFLESFFINFLIANITCLFASLFRYMSIQKNKKYFFSLSNMVKNFI